MADTVKKSRIVSDDEENLEEALLEEFNMRLKNCMSKDDIQAINRQTEQQDEETFYDNVSNNNGRVPKIGIASNDFLQNERHHYDLPPNLENGHRTDDVTENIYETLPERRIEKTEPADQYVEMSKQDTVTVTPKLTLDLSPKIEVETACYEELEAVARPSFALETTDFSELRSPEEPGKSVKDRMFLATDDAATLLFTQTVTSPMLTPSEENIDFLKGFQRENTSSDNTASDGSPPTEELDKSAEESEDPLVGRLEEQEQNVYENTDFGKQEAETIYENLKGPRENIYENLRDVKKAVQDLEELEHIYQDIDDCPKEDGGVYESLEGVKQENHSELMVDNSLYEEEEIETNGEVVTDLDTKEQPPKVVEEEEHYESIGVGDEEETPEHSEVVEERGEEQDTETETVESNNKDSLESNTTETYSKFIHHSKTESNYCEKYSEVLSKNITNEEVSNKEKDTETVPAEIVKNLKSQFSKNGGAEVVSITKKEIGDLVGNGSEMKMINIMKQINKFENSDSGDGNDSTVTESYTETTTIQSDVPEEKSLKKKKIKKSRKEEKENISVNDFDVVVNEEEYVYNVNVKNLCRSFGDLTKIAEDKQYNRRIKNFGRTKSLTNVLLSSNNNIENVFSEVSVRSLKEKFNIVENKNNLGLVKTQFKTPSKSSFSKFDALQKKNVLHIRSSDSTKAQEKFNGSQSIDASNCRACSKQVFQMEQIKAEKAVWHKNCFRCSECSKQLNVETYVSHDGNLYCKPHFKSLFAPKVVEEESPPRPRKPELIIRENQPLELPPDVVRGTGASEKPDLGLEDLQSLNVKERFQVFEQYQTDSHESDREPAPVNVKRSSSILSKLARFQAKGMDVGVSDDSLNGIPIEESSSEEEVEEEVPEGEDPTLYRAKRVQKEKPFHFTNLSEVKNKWEQGEQNSRDERREERKQEIQSIRNKLFLGKQGKMKEAYQQAIMQSESCTNMVKSEKIESCDTKSLKERFEKGQLSTEKEAKSGDEDTEVFQSEISKKSRSLFLELDAHASKPPQISPVKPQKLEVQKAREAYLAKSSSQDTVKSSEVVEDVLEVKTADIQQRFKFFETYKEPQKEKKRFRITPPRDPSQVKSDTPEREIYHDPEVVRSDETVDDSVIAKTSHTASKMLNKFRQMEENLSREPEQVGPKPLKRFTPPPEPARPESDSEEGSETEEESEDGEDQMDNQKLPEDLVEAQKAARAKQLRAKFEKWEAQEIKREQGQTVNIVEEYGDESQVESTKSLRARFESMREIGSDASRTQRVKVNRFVEIPSITEACESCDGKVYPLEKISVHGQIYHKNCFKCKECSCVLRMDTYSYNQGLLYCIPHFKRLFITKGNYDTAFGLDQHKEKWNINATMA